MCSQVMNCYYRSYDSENLADAMIKYDHTNQIRFNHTEHEYYSKTKSKVKAVMMSGVAGTTVKLDNALYFTLSKMYYGKRHGYEHVLTISNSYLDYYHPDVFSVSLPSLLPSDSLTHTIFLVGYVSSSR